MYRAKVVAGLLLLLAAWARAEEKEIKKAEVPAPVVNSVVAKYPKATLTRFERETDGQATKYEVTLTLGTDRVEVTVEPDGRILAEERTIAQKELPEAVSKSLGGSNYKTAKVLHLEKVTEADKPDEETYEVLVQDGKARTELVFSKTGTLKREEKKKPGEKD